MFSVDIKFDIRFYFYTNGSLWKGLLELET